MQPAATNMTTVPVGQDNTQTKYRIDGKDLALLRITDEVILKGREACVDQGTLLGLVRDGKLIEWDNDIDLSIMYNKRPKLRIKDARRLLDEGYVMLTSRFGITIKLMSGGKETKKVDLTYIYSQNGRYLKSYSDFEHQGFLAKVFEKTIKESLGLVQRAGNSSIRLFLWLITNVISWWYRSYFMKTIHMECPDWQLDLDKKELLGELDSIYIYNQPERYLVHKYGEDWQVPKRDWDYTTQDGGVVS
jgi:hypothetical protein